MLTSKDDLLEIGSSAVKNGNYDIAISAFHSFVLRDLKCVEANNIRDMIYKYYDNYGEAIKDFDRAIELKPECAAAYYNRACTYRKDVDDVQQAISNFTKAIELRSGYAEAYNNLAVQHVKMGRFEEAAREFARAIAIAGPSALLLGNLAYAQRRLDRLPEAAASARAALHLDSGSPQAHLILGSILAQDPRTRAESIPHLERAAETMPSARTILERVRELR